MHESSTNRLFQLPLVVAYAIYVPLAVTLVVLCRHQLNVDGVSYIRIAGYYAKLDFDLAVTGYWSPLLSWLLILWHLVGADAVLGGHVVNAVAGALFIAAVHYLAQTFRLSGPIVWAMPVSAGLLTLSWQGRGVIADILLAALVTLYLTRSYVMSRSLKGRDAALAGAVAGICYFAKYYALPFFLLHHFLATIVVGRRTAGWRPGWPHFRCWLIGTMACLLVASPWLAVLSLKYGRPTFATTGRIVRSYIAPESQRGEYWPPYQLMVIRPGRVTSWENPDEIQAPWPEWSPLDGTSGLVHQLRVFFQNGREISNRLFAADGLGLMYCVLLAMPILACLPGKNTLGMDPWPWRWSLVAVASYLSGLMLVFAGTRRYYWPLEGILLVLVGVAALQAASVLVRDRKGASRWSSPRLWQGGLAMVVIWAAALPIVETTRRAMKRPGMDLQWAAMKLHELGVDGPLATNHWHNAVAIAYHLDTACVGMPTPGSAEDVMDQLEGAGVRSFLLFDEQSWLPGPASLSALGESLGPPSHVIDEGKVGLRVYNVEQAEPAVGEGTGLPVEPVGSAMERIRK